MSEPVISADRLTREFTVSGTRVAAVDRVSFEVGGSEIVALLGPNGAGKTTLFRMLATLLRPTAGTACVAGADVVRQSRAVKRSIGYVPQMSGSPSRGLLVGEEIYCSAQLQGLSRAESRRRSEAVVRAFGLERLADRELRFLSGGQRRRVDIAIGLVHQPRVILLDEPTTGLDPDARAELWTHIRRLREAEGVSILMSTHYLDEAESLADRLIALNGGRVITVGSPRELKTTLAGDVVVVRAGRPGPQPWPTEELQRLDSVRSVVADGDELTVTVADAGTVMVGLVMSLVAAHVMVASVQVHTAELEDIFDEITGGGGARWTQAASLPHG
ncbi:ABC transporter ATP-binding protein [Streptomyces sp. NL15-2K]|uniref:ABC transporter ATP-binding protein n=1 Tax=Streptomyces sp. NL15-2K TaxID=376149 RepID=UPI000F58281C|nr:MULTISPECIES: ABC transporter ATP-binding protein [Actinomycetes]WKX11333.1 ABC transporter ATP-binding protein [Kutzneria buriramensis]GCB47259.1 hypothetical protein SNL152K_4563 [Streptomyces sp. NL15-2K]